MVAQSISWSKNALSGNEMPKTAEHLIMSASRKGYNPALATFRSLARSLAGLWRNAVRPGLADGADLRLDQLSQT